MKKDCGKFWDRIVALAHGELDPAASDHASACNECGRQLAELKKVVAAARVSSFDAPQALLSMAKGIMPQRAPRTIARLVFNSLAAAGARGSKREAFQLVFEEEGLKARLMYSPSAQGWDVLGKIESEGNWAAERTGKPVSIQNGRFNFESPNLGATELTLIQAGREVLIPAAEEALGVGS